MPPSQPGTLRNQRLPRSERRAQLLESAQAVFAVAGYHSAAMDDIAERAGVSKPVLYQHFPGKLDLYLALLDKHCLTLENLVREALNAPGRTAHSKVFATIEAYFDFVAQEDGAFGWSSVDLTSEPQMRNRSTSPTRAPGDRPGDHRDTEGGLDDDQALLMAVALAGMSQVSARRWLAQGATVPKMSPPDRRPVDAEPPDSRRESARCRGRIHRPDRLA